MSEIIIPIFENNGPVSTMIEKLGEEYKELEEAFYSHMTRHNNKTCEDLIEETYDCLQMCIGILMEIKKEMNVDLEKANDIHIAKLVNRQMWTLRKRMVRVRIPN